METPSQQRAVAARGNVLIMAGAGTGKTHTLIEHCLDVLREDPVSLAEILIVTFTEAAAAEMRQRLRAALEKTCNLQPATCNHFTEQLALFDAAHIGTLHSFCFQLAREHFYELGLDPQISILDEGHVRLLADETLDEQFQSHYEKENEFSGAVRDLIKIYGNGRDEKIRVLVLRLHHYSQTRPDAERWLAKQIENFSGAEPTQWREWFADAITNWQTEWLPVLKNLRAENPKAAECFEILSDLRSGTGILPASKTRQAGSLSHDFQKILAADENYPARKKGVFRTPLADFFDDAKFLNSLVSQPGNDPLAEDWDWTRGHMKTLLQLAREFSENFSARKRGDGVLDFHDLEQFALKLLWNFETEKPTEIANRWREKLRFVFVDEYQDINAAQDKIISALSRTGLQPVSEFQNKNKDRQDARPTIGNRFLVGDVKQSIYHFRLADPKIFRDYAKKWNGENGQTISLSDNFRSRESLIRFVNSFFELIMREEMGGVNYDADAKLKFGSPETRADFSVQKNPSPRTELLLRLKKSGDGENDFNSESVGDDLVDLRDAEKEARMLASHFNDLKKSRHEIWDDDEKKSRAVEWRDMAILLRAPSGKAEILAKEFSRAGIPLAVERGGFYDSSEILDLLSLLQLLDNPLQDVPLIAVLRSPLVGLSLDDLAEIRFAGNGHFWFALNQVQNPKSKIQSETRAKIEKFLERFSRWRKLARQVSLSQCLEEVLAETYYVDWLKSRARGAQKCANIDRLLNLAQKFDQFQRQGLFRFLKFIQARREAEIEPEVAPVAEENAVRLMSIHQSKGLEFPVVAVADLAKIFNTRDLHGEIIFDEELGLCPRVKPPKAGGRYPSLPHRLAQKRQRREQAGEELRLLYVAMTRARDTLILTGGITGKKWSRFFEKNSVEPREIFSAKSFLDWLGIWIGVQSPKSKIQSPTEGELPDLRWRILSDEELAGLPVADCQSPIEKKSEFDDAAAEKLRDVLDWKYEFEAATKRAAKTSVTALRRQAENLDDETEQKFSISSFKFSASRAQFQNSQSTIQNPQLSAADAGTAHHKFIQFFSLESATDLKSLESEAKRLEMENRLSADERAALVLENLVAFWNLEMGRKILANAANVKRELAFTAKFSALELDELLGDSNRPEALSRCLQNEFVVVQGVADLVVLLPQEIWLVDFKTDEVSARDLPGKIEFYAPQLKLYARALAKIYERPVTDCRLHFLSARRTEKIPLRN